MKVILIKDVKNQGKCDDIIEVSDGYANNFLIKNKLAVPYSKRSKEVLDRELNTKKENEAKKIAECEELKKQILKSKYIFYLKSGKNDQAFGSISTKQIHEELKKQGFNIDKKCIHLQENLDSLGSYNIEIELHKKVKFNLNIEIKKKN